MRSRRETLNAYEYEGYDFVVRLARDVYQPVLIATDWFVRWQLKTA